MKHIFGHFRLFLTAVTLLCVLSINHKEVPAFVSIAPTTNPLAGTELADGPVQDTQLLKQKISFEAVTSFALFDLANPLPFLRFDFQAPAIATLPTIRVCNSHPEFFRILFANIIQPNAP